MDGNFTENRGEVWVWIAFAPRWRLVLAFVVGRRTQANANRLLQGVAHVTINEIPFFTSDRWAVYRTALLQIYGQWGHPVRQGNRAMWGVDKR